MLHPTVRWFLIRLRHCLTARGSFLCVSQDQPVELIDLCYRHANTVGYYHSILQMTRFYATKYACPKQIPLQTACDMNWHLYTTHRRNLHLLGTIIIFLSTLVLKQDDKKHTRFSAQTPV